MSPPDSTNPSARPPQQGCRLDERLLQDCRGTSPQRRQSPPFRQCPGEGRDHSHRKTTVTRRALGKVEQQDRNDSEKEQRFQIPRIVLASKQRKPWADKEKHPKGERGHAEAHRL